MSWVEDAEDLARQAALALASCHEPWRALREQQPIDGNWLIVPGPFIAWDVWFGQNWGEGIWPGPCLADRLEDWGTDLVAAPLGGLRSTQVNAQGAIAFLWTQMAWLDQAETAGGDWAGVQPLRIPAVAETTWLIDRLALMQHLVGRERARRARAN